jgi:hypothetical protein
MDPFLGNDREAHNETTAVARQRPALKNESTFESGVFCVVLSEAITRDRPSLVQLVQLSTVE